MLYLFISFFYKVKIIQFLNSEKKLVNAMLGSREKIIFIFQGLLF